MQFTAKIKKPIEIKTDLQQTGQYITKHTNVNKQSNVFFFVILLLLQTGQKNNNNNNNLLLELFYHS